MARTGKLATAPENAGTGGRRSGDGASR